MHYSIFAYKLIDAIKFCMGKSLKPDHRKETIVVSFYLYAILKDIASMNWENIV